MEFSWRTGSSPARTAGSAIALRVDIFLQKTGNQPKLLPMNNSALPQSLRPRAPVPARLNAGTASAKIFSSKIPHNPLKRLISDERIQGNPSVSNPPIGGFQTEKDPNQGNPNRIGRMQGAAGRREGAEPIPARTRAPPDRRRRVWLSKLKGGSAARGTHCRSVNAARRAPRLFRGAGIAVRGRTDVLRLSRPWRQVQSRRARRLHALMASQFGPGLAPTAATPITFVPFISQTAA